MRKADLQQSKNPASRTVLVLWLLTAACGGPTEKTETSTSQETRVAGSAVPVRPIAAESVPEQESAPYAMGVAGPEWIVLPAGFGGTTSDYELLPLLHRVPVASLEELQKKSSWNPEGRRFPPEVLERHRRKYEILSAAIAPSLAAIDRQTVPSLLKAKYDGFTFRSLFRGLWAGAIGEGIDPDDPNVISRESTHFCASSTSEELMQPSYGRVRHITSGESALVEDMPELWRLMDYHRALCIELSDVVAALYRESGIWSDERAKVNRRFFRMAAAGPF